MMAFIVLISTVAMFWLGRAIGRAEAAQAFHKQLAELYAGLKWEDRVQFDQWIKEFADRSNR